MMCEYSKRVIISFEIKILIAPWTLQKLASYVDNSIASILSLTFILILKYTSEDNIIIIKDKPKININFY